MFLARVLFGRSDLLGRGRREFGIPIQAVWEVDRAGFFGLLVLIMIKKQDFFWPHQKAGCGHFAGVLRPKA